ncbi:TPA: hypothetical protein NGR52_004248 [Vibrio parahaemolyticus]|nr:hypothetical protein [Vibrio parahaemolyticus]
MKQLILLPTLLIAGCVVQAPTNQECEAEWTDMQTEFVYSIVKEVLINKDSMPNPNDWGLEEEQQLKDSITEAAREIFIDKQ